MLTCSSLYHKDVNTVWQAVERRFTRLQASGELADRHRRQRVGWLWTIIEDRLQQAIRDHPAVRAVRGGLEQGVLAGTIPPEVAARQILDAFARAGSKHTIEVK